MPVYTVASVPDSPRWKLESNGRVVSRHNSKTNAVNEAKRLARKYGGTVTVQNANGKFGRQIRP